MGLRFRLILLLSVIFLATLAVGSITLFNVFRHGVSEELTASVDQAAKLISVVVNQLPADIDDRRLQATLNDIVSIGSTRHLRISTNPNANVSPDNLELAAPQWFYQMLAPEPVGLVRVIDLRSKRRQVVIRADASAEINEAWREAVPLFLMLVLFGLFANGLIYVLLGRSLASLEQVGKALENIGAGDFVVELPQVGVSDIDSISRRVGELSVALRQSQAEAQSLARRSLTIQEQERRDLAQALHDELGQSINAIKALGVSIEQRATGPETVTQSVRSIIDVSSEMYERVRDMMSLLRPSILDELGLRLALEQMIDDWNSHHEDTFCHLHYPESLPLLDENTSISIFRIIQEALTNVVKHAAASDVEVKLATHETQNDVLLALSIADNGVGFDQHTTPRGLGIHGIRERVEALGGELTLVTGAAGTNYQITLPIITISEPNSS